MLTNVSRALAKHPKQASFYEKIMQSLLNQK